MVLNEKDSKAMKTLSNVKTFKVVFIGFHNILEIRISQKLNRSYHELDINKSIRRYAILRIGMVTSISNLISEDKACIASWHMSS